MMTLCAIATLFCGVSFAEEGTTTTDEQKIVTEEETAPLAECNCGCKKKKKNAVACTRCGNPKHKNRLVAAEVKEEDDVQTLPEESEKIALLATEDAEEVKSEEDAEEVKILATEDSEEISEEKTVIEEVVA